MTLFLGNIFGGILNIFNPLNIFNHNPSNPETNVPEPEHNPDQWLSAINGTIDGGDGFDTVEFPGVITNYALSIDDKEIVSISGPQGSTTLLNVEQIYLAGEDTAYSIGEVIAAAKAMAEEDNVGDDGSDNGVDTGEDTGGETVADSIIDAIDGTVEGTDGFDTVVFSGAIEDYSLSIDENDVVTVYGPEGATTLVGIEQVYVTGDDATFSMEEVIAFAKELAADDGATDNTDDATDDNTDGGDSIINAIDGTVEGTDGFDTVVFSGAIDDYSLSIDENDVVTVYGPEGATTLVGIEQVYVTGDDATFSMEEVIAFAKELAADDGSADEQPVEDTAIYGTDGDDALTGTDGDDTFYASAGNDTIDGGDGNDQIVFSGSLSDYEFALNDDGSVTVSSEAGGTDTLINIEAAWFEGDGSYITAADVMADDMAAA